MVLAIFLQLHCKVDMVEECDDRAAADGDNDFEDVIEEDEACHTMFKKECRISYRPRAGKVMVKVCPDGKQDLMDGDVSNSVVMDVRPTPKPERGEQRSRCVAGKVKICVKKYETECGTEYVKQR